MALTMSDPVAPFQAFEQRSMASQNSIGRFDAEEVEEGERRAATRFCARPDEAWSIKNHNAPRGVLRADHHFRGRVIQYSAGYAR
jgi:hypothetical protein